MPFVRVATNLSRNQLPSNFMPRLNSFLASALEKDPAVFKWQMETDKYMGQGCDEDGARKPFLLVEIESLKVFETDENCKKYVPKLFEFLQKETQLTAEQISTKFSELQPRHVGSKGKTMLG